MRSYLSLSLAKIIIKCLSLPETSTNVTVVIDAKIIFELRSLCAASHVTMTFAFSASNDLHHL